MLESWLYCSIQFWRQWLREGWKILLRKVMEPATSRGVRNHYEKLCQVVIVKNATNVSKLWKEYREIQKTTQEWTLAQIRSSLANSAEIAIARHTPHSDRKLRNLRLVKRPLYHFFCKSPNGLRKIFEWLQMTYVWANQTVWGRLRILPTHTVELLQHSGYVAYIIWQEHDGIVHFKLVTIT